MADLDQYQKNAIQNCLAHCRIEQNATLVPDAEQLTQLAKKILAKSPWGGNLSNYDVWSLIFEQLNQLQGKIPIDYSGLLKDVPDITELLDEVTSNLVQHFESLPRSFFVFFPLTGLPSIGTKEIALTDDIGIIDTNFTDTNEEQLAAQSDNEPLLATLLKRKTSSTSDNRYVRIKVRGYSCTQREGDVISLASAQLKHFVFTSLVTSTFTQESFTGLARTELPMLVSATDSIGDSTHDYPIQSGLAFFLARLQPNMQSLYFHDPQMKTTVLGAFRKPELPIEIAEAICTQFSSSQGFLSTPRDEPNNVRIKAAIEWWVDGMTNENQTISFLQFCIGLEALLGESSDNLGRNSDRGVTERLSDRYAYLLGNTQSERESLRKEFRTVYIRRGQIVHQRETHLRRSEDVKARSKSQQMLFNAIAKEINNLKKAQKIQYATLT